MRDVSIAGRASLLLVLVLGAWAPAQAQAQRHPMFSVRAQDADVRQLIEAGLTASSTLRASVQQLEESDVIVIVSSGILPSRLDGGVTFMGTAGGRRYVKVTLDRGLSGMRKLSTLGHELHHALEIARMPSIVDAASMTQAFRDIGFSRRGAIQQIYDTAGAVAAGERVWSELAAVSSDAY